MFTSPEVRNRIGFVNEFSCRVCGISMRNGARLLIFFCLSEAYRSSQPWATQHWRFNVAGQSVSYIR